VGAVAVVTNTRGSPDYVHMGGRRVESIYGFVPLPSAFLSEWWYKGARHIYPLWLNQAFQMRIDS
jgi:hypothetical protein